MNKGGYVAAQVVGMMVTVVFAQAVIRSLLDHSSSPLWGAFDWAPGGWGGRLAVLVLCAAAGAVLTGWAHDRQKIRDRS